MVSFLLLVIIKLEARYCFSLLFSSGPREDATRIGSAGVVRRQAVDISPLRRVNQAIWLITTGKVRRTGMFLEKAQSNGLGVMDAT